MASAVFTAVVTEVYCHRFLAHRAFRMGRGSVRVLDTYFRVIVGTDPHSWAAVHRLHHRHADTPLDPHSPRQRHPLAVVVGTPYLFAVAKRRLPDNRPAGLRIWALRSLVVAFYLASCGPVQVVVMLVVHLVCYMGLGGLINTVGHLYGTKTHPGVPGYDLALMAIPLLGHGYHNSHHAHPSAPRTGRLDPVWPLLRLGAALGQVQLDGPRAGAPPAVATARHRTRRTVRHPARRTPCCDASICRPSLRATRLALGRGARRPSPRTGSGQDPDDGVGARLLAAP